MDRPIKVYGLEAIQPIGARGQPTIWRPRGADDPFIPEPFQISVKFDEGEYTVTFFRTVEGARIAGVEGATRLAELQRAFEELPGWSMWVKSFNVDYTWNGIATIESGIVMAMSVPLFRERRYGSPTGTFGGE
jgi:hypothetical protein